MIVWAHALRDVRKTHICCELPHTNPNEPEPTNTASRETTSKAAASKHNCRRVRQPPWPSRPPLAPCPHKYRRHRERMQPRWQECNPDASGWRSRKQLARWGERQRLVVPHAAEAPGDGAQHELRAPAAGQPAQRPGLRAPPCDQTKQAIKSAKMPLSCVAQAWARHGRW